MPDLSKVDEEILQNHADQIRARARIEVRIVRKLLECLEIAGYQIDEEEVSESRQFSSDEMMKHLFGLDEAMINVYIDGDAVAVAWISLVFGNGVDVISDYSSFLDPVIQPANKLAEQIDKGNA